jgi:branched-chain amino acid transport system permease protein
MSPGYRKERLDRGIRARSDDIFVLSSYRELFYVLFPRILPVVVLVIFPLLQNIVGLYWEKVLATTCIIALLALSWNLLASVGLLSLGQAFFFGVGAYIAASLNRTFHWPLYISIPLATLGGTFLCGLILSPLLRLRGIYFALITLILPLLLSRVIEASRILGGSEGLTGLSGLPNYWVELYIPILTMLACLFGFRKLIGTDYGTVLRGIEENDLAVMAGSINIFWFKLQTVFIGGMPATFAGAFLAHYYQFVGVPVFGMGYSILPFTCAIVGGPGNFAGAVLGSFILVPISEILRAFGPVRIMFYSVILVVFVICLPDGLFPYIQRKYEQFERKVSIEVTT